MSSRDTIGGKIHWFSDLFVLIYSSTELQPMSVNSSKDAVLCLWYEKWIFVNCGSVLPERKSLNGSEWAITSRNKMSNNLEMVKNTQNMSLNHAYETGVALSDSANKICVKRSIGRLKITPRIAIKPRDLRNHAWQLNSDHWSLSWSHDRSFRIRHKKCVYS